MSPAPDAVATSTERDAAKAFELRGIAHAFWRHKLITIIGVVLTVVVTGALVVTAKPTYEARDTVLLKPPAELPAGEEGQEFLKQNPLLVLGGLEVASNALKNVMENKATEFRLEEAGLDGDYEIVIDPTGSGAIMDLVVESDTEAGALAGGDLVLAQAEDALEGIQEGTDPALLITVSPLTQPDEADPLYASRMRVGIVALLLGVLLTATAAAIAESRRRRKAAGGSGAPALPLADAPSGGTPASPEPVLADLAMDSVGVSEASPAAETEAESATPELEPVRASADGVAWTSSEPGSPTPSNAVGAGKGTGMRKRPRVRAASGENRIGDGSGTGNGNGSTASPSAESHTDSA
jgi:capsular polysaccharide biosynthesis protein